MALRFNTIMRALLAGNSTPSVPSFYFNFSNPQNVTLGAAQARGIITSTQNAHITMSASLSRVVGVAPLYVNIDMTGTTSDLTANATHDLFYSVNWGDPGAGQWANGVQSPGLTDKNWSFGPVGGHVFETPGTYLVTPTSTDGVNSAAKPGYVTVLDPNVVYDPAYGAGYETICISNSNNFTGAPGTGALPGVATYINRSGDTDMYAAWNTYKASNKRILFCKADSWTCSAIVSFNGLTGTRLSGYGTGISHTFAPGTMVSLTPDTSPTITDVFECSGSNNCHLGNIRASLNASHGSLVSGMISDSVAFTIYKVECRGATAAFSITPHSVPASLFKQDQLCLYECLLDEAYGYAAQDTPRVTGAVGAVGTQGIFSSTGHPFKRFNKVRLVGTPPTGLSSGVDYFISAYNLTANTFSLSAVINVDTPLAITVASTCDVVAQGLGGGQGVFVGITRGGIMGCYFDNCNNGEQTVRLPYLDRAHINNNYLARPNQTKNIFKIHSRVYDDISGITNGHTEKFVVTANVMDSRGGYSYNGTSVTQVGTPSIILGSGGPGASGQRVRNGIVENNFTYGCLGNPKDTTVFVECNCPNMTIRNNIADFSMGDRTSPYYGPYAYSGIYFATVTTSTPEQTVDVRIYNNTLYSNCASQTRSNFVYISAPGGSYLPVDRITIKNNLWYTPFYGGADHGAWRDGSGVATTANVFASNNTDTVAGRSISTAPNFVVQPPRDGYLGDWRPNTGSYAIGSGTVVPVLKDFNMATRTGAYDMGAVLP